MDLYVRKVIEALLKAGPTRSWKRYMDFYTKGLLTIIAIAVSVIAIHNLFGITTIRSDACGGLYYPCYVKFGPDDEPCPPRRPCTVEIQR